MEVTVGDFGRMMFEMMTNSKQSDLPDHWKSIRKEAEPLVRQLIALNDKMQPNGYEIVGYNEGGKKKLPRHERIRLAQERLWKVKAKTLKEGDQVWLGPEHDQEMYIGEQNPAHVVDVTKKGVYIEMEGCNCEFIVQIDKAAEVLKAPNDWDDEDKQEEYTSDEFWLAQADILGI